MSSTPEGWSALADALRSDSATAHLADAHPVWVGIKGQRIDARVVDLVLTREHHVVGSLDGDHAAVVSVFSEPEEVRRGEPLIVVVNGPSGVGKSSVMRALAEEISVPWVIFDEPVVGEVAAAFLLWPERAPQLHRGMLEAMASIARSGTPVALAAGGRSQAALRSAFVDVRVLWVGLDCGIDTLRQRDEAREDRWAGLVEQSVGAHEAWVYDLRFDTEATTPHQVAGEIRSHLAR